MPRISHRLIAHKILSGHLAPSRHFGLLTRRAILLLLLFELSFIGLIFDKWGVWTKLRVQINGIVRLPILLAMIRVDAVPAALIGPRELGA